MRTQHGFSLIELLTVLLIISAMTKIALEYTKDFAFQGRYEVTKDRYEKIKQAIIGRPDVIINGQPDISGFVADMGRLPRNLQELLVQDYCKYDYRISGNTPITDLGKPVSQELINDGAGTAGNTQQEWCEDDLYSLEPAQRWIEQSTSENCSTGNSAHDNQIKCENAGGIWTGWKGPYLTSQSPDYEPDALSDGWGNEAKEYCSDSAHTTKDTCQGASKTWKYDDHNYGWYVLFEDADGNSVNVWTNFDSAITLKLKSKGKDQCLDTELCRGFNTYDLDYPVNQPAIARQDWMVDINDLQFVVNTKNNGYCDLSQNYEGICSDIAHETWNSTTLTCEISLSESACTSSGYNWTATSGLCTPATSNPQKNQNYCSLVGTGSYWDSTKSICKTTKDFCQNYPPFIQDAWEYLEKNLCIAVLNEQGDFALSSESSIKEDGRQYSLRFATGVNLSQGKVLGFVLNKNCTTNQGEFAEDGIYLSGHGSSICVDTKNDDSFSKPNCNGQWYKTSDEQFCDGIDETECTGTLKGTYHPKVTFNITPNSTLPVINW